MSLIKFNNVTKSFYNGETRFNILKDFDFEFPNKGLIVIEGQSGSGKSTFLKLINGYEKNFSGDIYVDDINLKKIKDKNINYIRQKVCSYIFQNYPTIESLSVIDNLLLPFYLNGKENDDNKLMNEIDYYLSNYLPNVEKNALCSNLSGGEKQRLCIIRALLMKTKVILADEPTGSLDHKNSNEIMNLLKELSLKKLIILVTHDHKLALKYADKIFLLNGGKLYEKQY